MKTNLLEGDVGSVVGATVGGSVAILGDDFRITASNGPRAIAISLTRSLHEN